MTKGPERGASVNKQPTLLPTGSSVVPGSGRAGVTITAIVEWTEPSIRERLLRERVPPANRLRIHPIILDRRDNIITGSHRAGANEMPETTPTDILTYDTGST